MLYPRQIIPEIISYLGTENIIVLHGSRQVGKTSILKYLENYLKDQHKQTIFLDLEEYNLLELINSGVSNFLSYLQGEGFDLKQIQETGQKLFVFIDEIQYLQNPSSFLKLLADHHKYIQLIVSGSSSFNIKSKFKDSLVGRTVNFEIFGLNFVEFLEFKQIKIDIQQAILPIHIKKLTDLYKEFIKFGSYPKIVLAQSIVQKKKYLEQIIQTYIQKDIKDLANIPEINKFNNFLRILASYSGNLLNIAELSKSSNLSRQTIEKYLFILENTYIIKLIYPFSKSIKVEVVKTPKIFFYDTGLLQLLWLKNFSEEILGSIFETNIFAELVKLYGVEKVRFWRNKNQNEIDFILEQDNQIIPIEVKLNFGQFKLHSIKGFLEKYQLPNYQVVSLNGDKIDQGIYPWQTGGL